MPLFLGWLIARPAILVGIGAMALLGIVWTQDYFEDRGFRSDIAKLTAQVEKMQATYAQLQVSEQTEKANVATLRTEITEMNARLDVMNARARQIEAAANLRVARALRAGEEAAQELRAETTHVPPGNAAMNFWLAERLGS